MSILGKYTENSENNKDKYDFDVEEVTPAVLRDNEGDLTLKKSLIILEKIL